jgi:hypothetical protein
VGSLVASKAIPKDADVLVTINGTMDLDELAHAGRRFKGSAQTINLRADIFPRETDRDLRHPLHHHPLDPVPGIPRRHRRFAPKSKNTGKSIKGVLPGGYSADEQPNVLQF